MSTACIYARQSFDRHGDTLAVTRQLDLCRKFAATRGWTVAAEFVDNDRSATSGVERPEFERLLLSNPERVVVWHTDRLVRLTRELERVIDLGVNVHGVEAGHLDLSHPAGRATAKTVTAWAQFETEQKGMRQRAANDQRAESGQPYRCQRAFGYERDGMTVRESEAVELRAAAEGVIRGQSLSALVRDLNTRVVPIHGYDPALGYTQRGVTTATGKTWRTTTLKAALLSPRNAGQRRHRGQVVGPGAWPAILDADTVVAVRSILTDPSRTRPGAPRRYLLSGVLTCGKCHEPLSGTYIKDKGHSVYRCMGHVTRRVEPVDEYVTALVVARLSRPDAIDLFTRPGADDAALSALRGEREGLRERLAGLAEAYAMGDIDRAQLTAGTKRLHARVEQIEQKLTDSVTDPTLAEVTTAADVAAAFGALPQDTQRKVIQTLLAAELLPVGSGRRTFRPESVKIEWRTA